MDIDRVIYQILQEWKQEAGTTSIVLFKYSFHKLTICTSRPGVFIGFKGKLVNKYKELLEKSLGMEVKEINFIETSRYTV